MAQILIVDDDDVFVEFVGRALNAAGHKVTMTTSARAALELSSDDVPDLIVTDINMPQMSGFDLATALNADSARRWIPVIFMSSRDDVATLQQAFGVGAVDYLVKPFMREQLVDTVNKKLAETERRRTIGEMPQEVTTDSMPEIPGYVFISPLGKGGMAQVYLVDNVKLGRRCAIKVLELVEEGREQTELLTRFLEERALLARVDHPNVAKVFDHGISDKHVYIVLEFFPCGDLKLAMAQGISVTTSLAYVRQIAEGLGAIHAQGIIHRDVKPSNIMLRNDGSVALVDFGIAKELDAIVTLTRHGETVGTPYYMSPEQINSTALDARSDLYSLGAMFYEMLTQQHLFAGDRMESILMQHLHSPRPLLPKNLKILQPIIDMLLAVDPNDRFPNSSTFLEALSLADLMRFSDDLVAQKKSFSGMGDLEGLA